LFLYSQSKEEIHPFCTKVFWVLKNGQKKCPKTKRENTFVKKALPKWAESIKVRIAIIKILVCDDVFFVFSRKSI
jgi:hypothetical protein